MGQRRTKRVCHRTVSLVNPLHRTQNVGNHFMHLWELIDSNVRHHHVWRSPIERLRRAKWTIAKGKIIFGDAKCQLVESRLTDEDNEQLWRCAHMDHNSNRD